MQCTMTIPVEYIARILSCIRYGVRFHTMISFTAAGPVKSPFWRSDQQFCNRKFAISEQLGGACCSDTAGLAETTS